MTLEREWKEGKKGFFWEKELGITLPRSITSRRRSPVFLLLLFRDSAFTPFLARPTDPADLMEHACTQKTRLGWLVGFAPWWLSFSPDLEYGKWEEGEEEGVERSFAPDAPACRDRKPRPPPRKECVQGGPNVLKIDPEVSKTYF